MGLMTTRGLTMPLSEGKSTRTCAECVVRFPFESTAETPNAKVPTAVGTPVIEPVLEFTTTPVGNAPETMEY